MAYTNKATIENYLNKSIDNTYDTQLAAWITAMETHINNATRRVFTVMGTAEERFFDGSNSSVLLIDDLVELSSLTIDGETIDTADIVLYPANVFPKYKMKFKNGSGFFYRGDQNVAITAKWGYADAVPADITFVCTVLVAGILNSVNQPDGEVKSEKIGEYTLTFKDAREQSDFETAKGIIKNYVKYSF